MRLAVVVLLGGCYAPAIVPGAPCDTDDQCPSGLACTANQCGGPGAIDAAGIDGERDPDAAPIDAAPLGPWGMPVPLGELNSVGQDIDASLTADQLEVFFASARAGGSGATDIYRATRPATDQPFTNPVRVVELATSAAEASTEISPDGLTLYFNRDLGNNGGLQIFRATRPSRLAPFDMIVQDLQLSSDKADRNPTVSPNGLFAVVDRELAVGGDRELFYYTRTTTAADFVLDRQLVELGGPDADGSAVFDGTNNTIYFQSDRNGTLQVFTATRPSPQAVFSEPTQIVELGNGADPYVTGDGRVMIFGRNNDLFISTR